MFPRVFFPGRYFAPRYFPQAGGGTPPPPPPAITDPARVWSGPPRGLSWVWPRGPWGDGAVGVRDTVTLRVTADGSAAENVVCSFDFSSCPEALAGQAITGVPAFSYAGREGAAPPLAVVGALAVAGTVVSLRLSPSPSAAGYAYAVSCRAAFAGGNTRVLPGLLAVGRAAGATLSLGAGESAALAFDFSNFPESLAGQAVVGTPTLAWAALQAAAPALAVSAAALSGYQAQAQFAPSDGGWAYLTSALLTFSGGNVRVCPGTLLARWG